MAELGTYHPQGESARLIGSLAGARFTEGVTFGVDGVEAAGPDQAQAILVLQNTLASEASSQRFWTSAAHTVGAAMESPGFIRFIGFADGLCNYGLGFWRSVELAQAFARGGAHREAICELHGTGSQYTHFAGLYRAHSLSPRHFFCELCGQATSMPATHCQGCGNPLTDIFTSYVRRQQEEVQA